MNKRKELIKHDKQERKNQWNIMKKRGKIMKEKDNENIMKKNEKKPMKYY